MSFWKPGTAKPASTLDRSTESEATLDPAINSSQALSNANLGIQASRQALPIHSQRDHLLFTIENHQVTIIVGQTGSGKTTQIPQYLFEAGWASSDHVIACTQPRRVAATSVATRVAQEVGTILGEKVGYTIRFEDCSHPKRTRIKFLTDGMLFREGMRDPLLSKYSVIMVDEAHERGAYTDMLLGVLKKVLRKRKDLRVVVSSATIDAQAFLDFFQEEKAAIVSLEGRMYPVEVAYLRSTPTNYVTAAIEAIWQIHLKEPKGDILVFLTGREEIDTCLQALADRALDLPTGSLELLLLPLHAGLSIAQQTAIFAPTPRDQRKIIVSTNIAEASVTIDGIRFVVDCGFVKLRLFNPKTGMDSLSVVPESLASATQRAGRAGRTLSGKCLRLFTEEALSLLSANTPPELCRSEISLHVLQLKALGIDNIARFEFLPPAPPAEMMAKSLEFLASLGVLDEYARLTQLGERMSEMPVEPMLAKILLSSFDFGCGQEMLSIAAMTCVSSPFIIPDEDKSAAGELERRKFTAEEGDHLTLLNVYNAFVHPRIGKLSSNWAGKHKLNYKALARAVNIRSQLVKYLRRFGIAISSCEGDHTRIRRCLVSGYFSHAAKRMHDGTYRSIREGAVLHVHPSSTLFTRIPKSKYVIYHEVIETTKRFMRDITVVEQEWLAQLAPHYYRFKE